MVGYRIEPGLHMRYILGFKVVPVIVLVEQLIR